MKILSKSISRDGSGSVTMIPYDAEDIWFAYNLIRPGDIARAGAVRKVPKATSVSETARSVATITVHMTLSVRVKDTTFDATTASLAIHGRVSEENKYVSLGQYHTLDLQLGWKFTLIKESDGWDSVAVQQLTDAADGRSRASVWAVVMQEGLANIVTISDEQTIFRQRVETSIAGKRAALGEAHDRSMVKFYETLLSNLLRLMEIPGVAGSPAASLTPASTTAATSTINPDSTNKTTPLLLASPGFTAANFLKHMRDHAVRTNDKALAAFARTNVIVAHAASGHMHSLSQVLGAPSVLAKLSDTRYARETALMDKFTDLMRADDGRAWYGPGEVRRAVARDAVGRGGGVLLISNKLFRADNVDTRRHWIALVDKVRADGGEVRVLSSAHESGKRLEALGDIAAILTFPIFDLDEEGGEDEAEYQTMFGTQDQV